MNWPVSSTPRAKGQGVPKDPSKVLSTILRDSFKSRAKRTIKEVKFNGVILFSSFMTYDNFKNMFDSTFTEMVYKEPVGTAPATSPVIVNSIVYVPELCSCLPFTKSADFWEKISKITAKSTAQSKAVQDTKGGVMALIKEHLNIQDNSEYADDFTRILRYPMAYSLADQSKKVGQMEKVVVKFPRNYDFSKCVIV